MKRKDKHQSKPVGYQGRNPNIPSSSLNNKTRRQGEDLPGHLSQARTSPLWEFCIPKKTENPFGTRKIPKKSWHKGEEEKNNPVTRSETSEMIGGSGVRNNLSRSRRMYSERKFSGNCRSSSRKRHTSTIERVTLKNGAESSNFCPKVQGGQNTQCKTKKTFVKSKLPHRAGVNYMGVEYASTTNP